MITIMCPICKEENSEEVFGLGDLDKPLRNVICRSCGLVYINPRPSVDEYLAYQGESGKGSGHHGASQERAEEKIHSGDMNIKGRVLEYLMPYIKPETRVLDVGSGFGTLLYLIHEKTQAVVCGIEMNKRDVEMAREKFNLDLFHGSLEQYGRECVTRYDLIILHHTFEHLQDPVGSLQTINNMLTKDGYLYIAVPNILNMKKRPEIFFQLGHAFTYSPASMRRMLSLGGFKIFDFNIHAAYPGGTELVAIKSEDPRPEYKDEELLSGENWLEVKKYVARKKNQFNALRNARDNALFWMPEKLRVKLGRLLYLVLKKI